MSYAYLAVYKNCSIFYHGVSWTMSFDLHSFNSGMWNVPELNGLISDDILPTWIK